MRRSQLPTFKPFKLLLLRAECSTTTVRGEHEVRSGPAECGARRRGPVGAGSLRRDRESHTKIRRRRPLVWTARRKARRLRRLQRSRETLVCLVFGSWLGALGYLASVYVREQRVGGAPAEEEDTVELPRAFTAFVRARPRARTADGPSGGVAVPPPVLEAAAVELSAGARSHRSTRSPSSRLERASLLDEASRRDSGDDCVRPRRAELSSAPKLTGTRASSKSKLAEKSVGERSLVSSHV